MFLIKVDGNKFNSQCTPYVISSRLTLCENWEILKKLRIFLDIYFHVEPTLIWELKTMPIIFKNYVDNSLGGVKNKLDRRYCFTISRLVLFWTGFTAYHILAKIYQNKVSNLFWFVSNIPI